MASRWRRFCPPAPLLPPRSRHEKRFNSWTELELARKEKEKLEREKVQKVKKCIEILADYYKTYHNIDFDPVAEDEWEDFAKALDEAADMFKLVMRSPAEPISCPHDKVVEDENRGLKATVSTKIGDGEWTTKTLSAAEADKILKDFIRKAF